MSRMRGRAAVIALSFGVVTVLAIGLLIAAPWQERDDAGRILHDHETGPLSLRHAAGVVGDAVQVEGDRWSTFGGFRPCNRADDGATIRIVDVRFPDAKPEPLRLRSVTRRVPPPEEREGSPEDVWWGPIGSSDGIHPDYNGDPAGGVFSTEFPVDVSGRCDDLDGREPTGEASLELLIEMKADRRGAYVPWFDVDYEVDGKEHSVRVDVGFYMCGTETQQVEADYGSEACNA